MRLGDRLKFFEVRDIATHIPVTAMLMRSDDWMEDMFLSRGGFGPESDCVMVTAIATETCRYDPYNWPNQRTLGTAHRYIAENWDRLQSGQVVDVEFILGETLVPKCSELYRRF